MSVRAGSCLCGAITFRATLKDSEIQACHCRQCQQWTGGGPLLSARVSEIEVTGAETSMHYRASTWGERVFCPLCGSPMWWKMQDGKVATVAVGLLDDQSGLRVTEEIFVDYRPDWLPPWPGATQSTEAQEMAKLDAFLNGETA